MSNIIEIVLVIDDATWRFWQDNKQWKDADEEHIKAALQYRNDNRDRLAIEYPWEFDYKAAARKYYHENKDRLNEQRKNVLKRTKNKSKKEP